MAEKSEKKPDKKVESKPQSFIHVNEFIFAKKIDSVIAAGFRVFMKGNVYQRSMEDFEKAFKKYQNRKI